TNLAPEGPGTGSVAERAHVPNVPRSRPAAMPKAASCQPGDLIVGRLDGRVAIVTGGAGGIGGATARALAGEGASVVIVDIDGARAEHVAREVTASSGSAFSVSADLSEETEVLAAIKAAVTRYGRLDVLHNNAAM